MKKHFFTSFLLALFLGSIMSGAVVFAAGPDDPSYGLNGTATAAKLPMGQDLPTLVGNVVGTALSLVGIIFFGLMIYGGILWMTDRGKEEQAKKAFDTITAAVIGIIIVLASYAITKFAFSSVASQDKPPYAINHACQTSSECANNGQCLAGSDGSKTCTASGTDSAG